MQHTPIGRRGALVSLAAGAAALGQPLAALAQASQLAISVEDKGGVPESRGPRLPYLFTGALVQKAL